MIKNNIGPINTTDRRPETLTAEARMVKDWSVMVYLAGDNNLSENMAYSLESLGRLAGSLSDEEKARINLLAFFEGSSLTAPPMYIDFSDLGLGKEPFRQAAGMHNSENGNDPGDSLLDFIRWCTADDNGRGRRAANYALILSGHSLGFHGSTFLGSDTSGKSFTLAGMRRTLEKANRLYLGNQTGDDRIAILGFDSCVMSMVEVGYEFKDVARTFLASEGSLPNSGWGYAPMMSSFVTALAKKPEPGLSAEASQIQVAAKSFVRSFTDFYKDLAVGGGSIDISAWDLDHVHSLADAIDRLGIELNRSLTNTGHEAFHQLKKILLQSHYDSQTYMADQYVDVKDFCEQLAGECGHSPTAYADISAACRKVIEAVDGCVLKCGFSGDAYQFSNGISIYFPWSSVAFALTDARYRSLRFVCGEGEDDFAGPGRNWYAFLLNYVGNITVRKARRRVEKAVPEPVFCGSIYRTHSEAGSGAPAFAKGGESVVDSPSCTRSFPPTYKSFPPTYKSFPPTYKGAGNVGSYLTHFSRFKNFELGWNIAGFADDKND